MTCQRDGSPKKVMHRGHSDLMEVTKRSALGGGLVHNLQIAELECPRGYAHHTSNPDLRHDLDTQADE